MVVFLLIVASLLQIKTYIPYKNSQYFRFFLTENKKNKEMLLLTIQGDLACENC
jgi:hypothetical protein